MVSGLHGRDGYSLSQAVRDVFGADRVWLSWIVVIVAGLLGGAAAPLVTDSSDASAALASRFTGAAAGVVVGGLLSLLPRTAGLVALGSQLQRRPADLGSVERPWWPLRLLAAALANTPPARRTNQDFTEAVGGIVTPIRGLLSRRSWPACAAAFAAPALGLAGAWQAWQAFIDGPRFQEIVRGAQQDLPVPGVFAQASLPMIVSIVSSLLLMLAVVGIDQWSRKTVQAWATAVQPSDAESGFVSQLLGDGMLPALPGGVAAGASQGPVTVPPSREAVAPPPSVAPPISSEELGRLGDLFRDG
jgi:hypothetical protein